MERQIYTSALHTRRSSQRETTVVSTYFLLYASVVMSFFLDDFDCHRLFVLQSYTFDYFAERTLSQNGLHLIIGLFREDDASICEVLVLCTSLWRHIANVLEPDVLEERRQKREGSSVSNVIHGLLLSPAFVFM